MRILAILILTVLGGSVLSADCTFTLGFLQQARFRGTPAYKEFADRGGRKGQSMELWFSEEGPTESVLESFSILGQRAFRATKIRSLLGGTTTVKFYPNYLRLLVEYDVGKIYLLEFNGGTHGTIVGSDLIIPAEFVPKKYNMANENLVIPIKNIRAALLLGINVTASAMH
jgi:hypothetical protein